MDTSHLNLLNDPQKKAVLATEGPLLILAGAGSGKTKTITTRILHLIKSGVDPSSILAITFTNKAAKEMRERVLKAVEQDPALNFPSSFRERPFLSTFHYLGVHIIKENHALLGLPRHFKIFDAGDSKRAVREAIEIAGWSPKEMDPGKIANVISREKGEGKTLEKFMEKERGGFIEEVVQKVWPHYERILREEKALDFDDLLLKSLSLLKNEEIGNRYRSIWKYVHVDEYQDTNGVQYQITRALVGNKHNICVVGDIDQNIYTWRGARLEHMFQFEKDYPEAVIIVLEENYRSTKTILSVANTIIEKNTLRKEKNLFTRNSDGEKISLFKAMDERDEAVFVATRAEALIKKGIHPQEIAVLYRANFQSRALEEAFLSRGIPYQLLGVKFFERKEIKDALSFIRAALEEGSVSDMKRVINVPARGIGKVTLLKIVEGKEESLPPKTRLKIEEFRKILADIRGALLALPPSQTMLYLLERTGLKHLYEKGEEKDEEKLENLKELVSFATRYDNLPPLEGIELLLAEAALTMDQDNLEVKQNSVKLMTVHASKGLEFDCVFITGLEEGLFPHGDDEDTGLEETEEERRLFYVALTRARKKVYLCWAETRTIFGSTSVSVPSQFIADISEEYLEQEKWSNEEKRRRGIEAILSIDF